MQPLQGRFQPGYRRIGIGNTPQPPEPPGPPEPPPGPPPEPPPGPPPEPPPGPPPEPPPGPPPEPPPGPPPEPPPGPPPEPPPGPPPEPPPGPPPGPPPEPPPGRGGWGKLILLFVAGALVAGGVAVPVALGFAEPDIPEEALGQPTETGEDGEPVVLAQVQGLDFDSGAWTGDPGSWEVVLTWSAGDGVDHYVVVRDGKKLDELTETSYTDDGVTPEGNYSYEVIAVDAAGTESKPAKIRVKTVKLDEADARVEGKWLLSLKVVSSSVGAGGGSLLVTLDPTCKEGPCDVRWSFKGVANSGVAKAKGASYSGVGHGGLFTRDCHGGIVSATAVTLEFKVTTAHTVGQEWRATKIAGTLTESVPQVSNCLSARNVWRFEGSAQG